MDRDGKPAREQSQASQPARTAQWLRPLYLALGVMFVALGVIGAMLPVMPTTIFLILAAWCFGKSSPRLEAWLLSHKTFGPVITAWRDTGAIPRRGKVMACIGIAAGFVIFWVSAHPGLILLMGVAAIMAGCAWFIVSRPEPILKR